MGHPLRQLVAEVEDELVARAVVGARSRQVTVRQPIRTAWVVEEVGAAVVEESVLAVPPTRMRLACCCRFQATQMICCCRGC